MEYVMSIFNQQYGFHIKTRQLGLDQIDTKCGIRVSVMYALTQTEDSIKNNNYHVCEACKNADVIEN